MKVLVFAGAGSSTELGIPTMRPMALDVLAHLETTTKDSSFVADLRKRLEEVDGDLESVIDDIDRLCDAHPVLEAYGGTVDSGLVDAAKLTRAEIEWFVQHACERVRSDMAAALWGPLIRACQEHELTIATTNYDRAVELACQRVGSSFTDGFDDFSEREWADWLGFDGMGDGLRLLKMHGSTDWYQVANSSTVVKLRHPMPLFGGVTLQLEGVGPGVLGSALVMPSREKRKNQPPFPQISHEVFASAKLADAAIFVGTSLRDPDLRSLVADTARRTRTIVVGPSLDFGPELVPTDAAIVRDLASGFLVSTLPRMLATGSWPDAGSVSPGVDDNETPTSILPAWAALQDLEAGGDQLCDAIEALWRRSIGLAAADIVPLIDAGSPRVARDALALVALSHEREGLVEVCRRRASQDPDPGFRQDLDLLEQMAASATDATSFPTAES